MDIPTYDSIRRIQSTYQHLRPPEFNNPLSLNPCNSEKPFTIQALQHPSTIGILSKTIHPKIPNEVFLFPLYTRPIFPYVRISAVPRQLVLPPGNGQPAVDKIKKVLERLTTESKTVSPSVIRSQIRSEEGTKRVAFYKGPIVVTDRSFVESLVKLKAAGESHVALCLAKSSSTPVTKMEDVFNIGVLASIEVIEVPNKQPSEVVLTGTHRIVISAAATPKSISGETQSYFRVAAKELKDQPFDKDNIKNKALVMALVAQISELCKLGHPLFQDQLELISFKADQRDPSELADLCASLTTSSGFALQQVLMETNIIERIKKVQRLILAEIEVCKLVTELKKTGANSETPRKLATSDKNSKIVNEFKEKLKALTVPDAVQKTIDEELTKLAGLDPVYNATEHYTCRNYVNWLTSLPWGLYSKDNLDISYAEKIMEDDHYGIQDVKERILEFIAVASIKGNLTGKILCFVGPPGTGKTSFGKSIARATKRKFARFSVGGMKDVAEIKGHRRTYIGALPGKLVQSLKTTATANPVILIDEIDKLSRAHDGDPASALLEVLDPEQNNAFLDHYLDVPLDLSKVLFICTANSLETIPKPLLDRMEIIHLSGYFLDEKLNIAKKYLIPKIQQETAIKETQLQIEDSALIKLISQYCREAGVRQLQKQTEKIFRKVAMRIARGETMKIIITTDNLENFVGKPKFTSDRLYESSPPGVVTGLAWSSMGGSLIWIETVLVHQKNAGLKTTGKLGKVMQESIDISQTVAKKFLNELEPSNTFFDQANMHIHFPEGATPKDGPSAGSAIVTSFLSLALNKPIKRNLAMTGEISLTGKVLPVGGIKEKVMAAKRSGIMEVILPEKNRRDFEELPEGLKQGVAVHYVENYNDVFAIAFGENPMKESFLHPRPKL